jgi:hypothetical protein
MKDRDLNTNYLLPVYLLLKTVSFALYIIALA